MITKVIGSNQGCKECAKNHLENLCFYYPNLGSELVGPSHKRSSFKELGKV